MMSDGHWNQISVALSSRLENRFTRKKKAIATLPTSSHRRRGR